jgi:polyisoprenoid-binding protein YceI
MSNEGPGMTTTTTLGELTGDYILDPAGTRIGFVARQAIFTTVRGQLGVSRNTVLEGGGPLVGNKVTLELAPVTVRQC